MKTVSIVLDDNKKISRLKKLKGVLGFRIEKVLIKHAPVQGIALSFNEIHVDYDESQIAESRITSAIRPILSGGFESNTLSNKH